MPAFKQPWPLMRELRWGLIGWLLVAGCKKQPQSLPQEPQPEAAVEAPVAEAIAAPAPPTARSEDWSAQNGVVRVAQRRLEDGACRISSQGAAPWEEAGCHGDKTALAFASPDGERVILLMTLPALSTEDDVTVLEVLERGRPTRAAVARAFLGKNARIRKFSWHFAWINGTGQLPGDAPALSGDHVVFSTVEGRSFSIGFDGSGIPEVAPRAPRTAQPDGAPACAGLIKWVEGGSTHFANDAAEIPTRFRSVAQCVSGDGISTISRGEVGRSRMADSSAPGRPVGNAPKGAAPAAASSSNRVFCKFKFIQGTLWKERSFCTSGSVGAATDSCNASAKGMKGAAVAECWCTDDAQYIGSRC